MILILDFGSQTTQLISRRIRECGVYTEVLPGDAVLSKELLKNGKVKGIILSGSPESVYTSDGAVPDKQLYESELPLLGICYGLQRMTFDNGGKVEPLEKREYGRIGVKVNYPGDEDFTNKNQILQFLTGCIKSSSLNDIMEGRFLSSNVCKSSSCAEFTAWMSHGDTLTRLAPGFHQYGTSSTGFPVIIAHETRPWFGLQFHPEVSHCERGSELLAAFVFGVCGCARTWSMEQYIEMEQHAISQQVGTNPVLLLISGGVDSTVVGALLLKTLPCEQVHLMYFDTGFMRKDETRLVAASLEHLGAKHLYIVDAQDEFLGVVKGVDDPERKRRIIGDLFIQIQEREVVRLRLPESYFLAQGTLYTDLIESGKGVGKKARIIKTHHNVGSPLVEGKRKAGRIVEPLDRLYKDEVRRLGTLLGVDREVIRRHPFPGPGLAIRILGEVTKEKCDILRAADALFIEELKRRTAVSTSISASASVKEGQVKSLYDEIWQAFAVLLPVRSVGVAGDERRYGWVLALRAIVSVDGMTADVYAFPPKDLIEISTLITNTIPEIGRVVYDISSKPPATIEWE